MLKEIRLIEHEEVPTIATTVSAEPAKLKLLFANHFPKMAKLVTSMGLELAGMPFTLYHKIYSEKLIVELGIPLSQPMDKEWETDSYFSSSLPGRKVVTAQHFGPYSDLDQAYEELEAWMGRKQIQRDMPYWEVYVSDPTKVDDLKQLRTDIFIPVLATDE